MARRKKEEFGLLPIIYFFIHSQSPRKLEVCSNNVAINRIGWHDLFDIESRQTEKATVTCAIIPLENDRREYNLTANKNRGIRMIASEGRETIR